MSALVNPVSGSLEDVLKKLKESSDKLKGSLNSHMGKKVNQTWFDFFRDAHVELGQPSEEPGEIGKQQERIIELVNQIHHMEVIIGFLSWKGSIEIENIESCHPTTSSGNDTDECDINFATTVVEVFGGVNYKNNKKLKKDIISLKSSPKHKKILACYKNLDDFGPLKDGDDFVRSFSFRHNNRVFSVDVVEKVESGDFIFFEVKCEI